MGWFGANRRVMADAGALPRKAERYQTIGLSCPIGEIADLSASGMRLHCKGRPGTAKGDIRQFIITSSAQRLEVTGRIAWVRRCSWNGFALGVHFLNLKPGVEAALVQLAKYGFVGKGAPSPEQAAPARASMAVEDLYRILGVRPQSTPDQIHAAYRALARTVHPDVCKDDQAGAQFALISKAYRVLRDADQRRKYDRLLANCT